MSNFEHAFDRTMALEGGYSDHPLDSGGRTNYGITEATYRAWLAGQRLDAADISDINPAIAKLIYKDVYWNPLKLDLIGDRNVAAEIFDTAVNCGHKSAVKMLQRAANFINPDADDLLEVDGILGPVTASVVNRLAERYGMPLLRAMNGEQYVYYRDLVERRPKDRAFARGWTKRLEVLSDEFGES